MKKIGYMFIGAIFTLIISIGFLSFADTTSPLESDLEAEEIFADVHHTTEDGVSVVEKSNVFVVQETPIWLTSLDESIVHGFEKTKTKEEVITNTSKETFLEQLKKLEIKIESDQTKIEIKQERKNKRVKSEVEIELKNEKMKLEDQRAEEFIEEIFSAISVEATQDLQLIADQLLEEFQMNLHEVEIEIKAEKLDGTKYKFEIDN